MKNPPFLKLLFCLFFLACISLCCCSCEVTVGPDGTRTTKPRADIILPIVDAFKPQPKPQPVPPVVVTQDSAK